MFSLCEFSTTTLALVLPTIARAVPHMFLMLVSHLDHIVLTEQEQWALERQEQRIIDRMKATAPMTAPAA